MTVIFGESRDGCFVRSHRPQRCLQAMNDNDYPKTVAEVIDDSMRFKPAVLAAARAFKASHPWQGSLDELHQKFRTLYADLSSAYGIDPPRLVFGNDHVSDSGRSAYLPKLRTVILRGRPSVVTALHEYRHFLGGNERQACKWSVNLFKRVWPHQFRRCMPDGHMLRAPTRSGGSDR
jgi:hypothetical protein